MVLRPDDFRAELVRLLVRLLVRAVTLRGTDDLRAVALRAVFLDVRLRGTFSPFSLASLNPMASACLRLVTLRPPLILSVPRLRLRIALPTVELAFLLYFLPDELRLGLRAGI